MFTSVASRDISFPPTITATTLDSIPKSFNAWQSYSNIPTASTYTTQSFSTSFNAVGRWCLNGSGDIIGIAEAGTQTYIWKTSNNTLQTGPNITSPGTIKKIVYDGVTDSWALIGASSVAKISCSNTSSVSYITNPNNPGSQYGSAVAFNGKVYGIPVASTTANTSISIWDLTANTAVTASGALNGNVNRFGACVTSVGTIYFAPETSGNMLEYNPTTGTATTFGSFTSNPGYSLTNLPNGTVFLAQLGTGTSKWVINPINKNVRTFTGTGIGTLMGQCVGQDGLVYFMYADSTTAGLNAYNPLTDSSFATGITLQRPSASNRGFQDCFTLADGRLIMMPGQNNSGLVVYVSNLSKPANNTYSQQGMANPILQNANGL